ncbi:hypothetical protein GCM10009583_01710 [Ornithinicoccus hortensis]|uniref:Uncharacterized protein n=1 Tax=Ornithinicoccus hortensis TaxID=82346 RepID=A0A542YUT1_9MICO|nr:hypothetical protein FB467_3007 [Ornithinicoccus hortensis]
MWLAAGCALIAGVALGAGGARALGGDDGPDSSATVTLPEQLDGMRPEADVIAEVVGGSDNAGAQETVRKRQTVRDEATVTLSAAYGGATTAGAAYSDDELETSVTVFAVAATSPGLWSSQDTESAPEILNLATPMEWVEVDGDAQCLTRPQTPYREGTDPADIESYVVRCQVSAEDHTVILEVQGSQMPPERGLELVQLAADEVEIG